MNPKTDLGVRHESFTEFRTSSIRRQYASLELVADFKENGEPYKNTRNPPSKNRNLRRARTILRQEGGTRIWDSHVSVEMVEVQMSTHPILS